MNKKPRKIRNLIFVDGRQMQEIGARIKQARLEAGGLTQPELADLLNVSVRSIQNYEAGVTVPYPHFERLEQITNRTIAWFLRGDEPLSPADRDMNRYRHDELLRHLAELREQQAQMLRRLAALEAAHHTG